MSVQKAYKFRLYPNVSQQKQMAKTFGCVRKVWNHYVDLFNVTVLDCTCPLLKKHYRSTTELKQEYPYFAEVSAAALQQKANDFKEYMDQKFNKNRKKKLGQPKFKSKRDKQSFRLPNQKFYIKGNRIQLEKIGKVKIVLDREIPEDVKCINVTVSKNKAGQYFASVLVEQEIQSKPKTNKTVGIDVGLKSFLVTSDNESVANPRYFRENQAKLARLQRFQSRKKGSKKGEIKSSRWLKLQERINRLHNDIANQRSYFLHNISSWLVREYDVICSENLNVAGMLRNHKLAKSISDASWSELFRQIAYKSEWYGKHYYQIGMFEPSTQTCSNCGKQSIAKITLKDRTITCEFCGFVEDRDFRAAKNIKSFGVKNDSNRTQSDETAREVVTKSRKRKEASNKI